MLLHAVCDQVARVYDVFFAGLECDLVDLAFAAQSEQAATSGVSVTPVGQALRPSARSSFHRTVSPLPCLCSREATGSKYVRSMPVAHCVALPSNPIVRRGAR